MRTVAVGFALVAAVSVPGFAQTVLGPGRCTTCHDHARQTRTWQQEEPTVLKERAHVNTLMRLEGPRAGGFARAVGLTSPWALSGSCVACHATVFRGGPNAGVSCESCHRPSGAWIELHQAPGAYPKAVAAGMKDLKRKPVAIAQLCVGCHVVTDGSLLAAGHPSGASFDAGSSLQRIAHWTTNYDAAQVTAAARAALSRPAAAAPPRDRRATAGSGAEARPSTPPGGEAPRWQGARPLPQDYVPEPIPEAPSSSARGSVPEPALRAPTATSSLAEDTLIAGAPPERSPGDAAEPRTAAAMVLELRGKGLLLLCRLLQAGHRPPAPRSATGPPAEFKGPEGEMLRLQDEIYRLVWETLRKPAP